MKRINIKGPIIPSNDKWFYDLMEQETFSPKDLILPETGEPVEVIINSGGGDVYAGSEIYTALRSYEGEVTVKIVGIAASAASVIAMAGDSVEISPTAQIMIHNVSTGLRGDNRAFAHESEVLEGYNRSIANSYLSKTDKTMDELLELMANTTWLTADMAVENGFADKVMFAVEEAPVLVASSSPVFPSDVITKLASLKQTDMPSVDMDKLAEAVAERLVRKEAKGPEHIEQTAQETPSGLGRFCF